MADPAKGREIETIRSQEEEQLSGNEAAEEISTLALSEGEQYSRLSSLSLSVVTATTTSSTTTSAQVTDSCIELFLENGLLLTKRGGNATSTTSSSTSYPITGTESTPGTTDDDTSGMTNDSGTITRTDIHENKSVLSANNENIVHDRSNTYSEPIEETAHPDKYKQLKNLFSKNLLLPDEMLTHVGRFQIFRSIEVIRALKFLVLTFAFLGFMYVFTRISGFEHDASYNIELFFKDDMGNVITDSVSFFVIGRLHERRGIDRLFPFILPMISINIIASWLATEWMKTSIITDDWRIIVFALAFVSILMTTIFLHLKFSIEDGSFFHRSIEASFILVIFLAPHIADDDLHLNYWYVEF